MRTATQTLYIKERARQHTSGVDLHACAVREFPLGCPVQWEHIDGKPPLMATVVAHGHASKFRVSPRWEVETKSGARHFVDVHRLEPQEPPTVRVKKTSSVGISEQALEVVAAEGETPKRPTSFEPPSQEIWP